MKIFYKIKFCFVKKWIDLSLLLKGIRIKKAETIEELDEVRHFAWEVYALQERYIDPNFFPKKMFDDEFDKYSTYFFATNKNKIIGIVRIVLNSDFGFPIEKLFRFKEPNIEKNKIAEVSRLMVAKNYRKKTMVMLGLCKKCFEESLLRKIGYWYAFLPKKLKNYFKERYGIKFINLHYKELTIEQLKHREPFRFYFRKMNPVPVLISFKEILKEFKL